jgi:hypothetical protein
MPSSVDILAAVLVKNADDPAVGNEYDPNAKPVHPAPPEGPAATPKPAAPPAAPPSSRWKPSNYIRTNPKTTALMALATALTAGGASAAWPGGSLADEVDRNPSGVLGSALKPVADAVVDGGGAVIDRIRDPFKGVSGVNPNSLPAPAPEKPGMLQQYWKNLKGGDPTTMIGTGAAALLAGVLAHNLLKKRTKR